MAQKGKGGLLGHFRIDYARSPEIGISDIQKRGIGQMQSGKPQLTHLLYIEITRKAVITSLLARYGTYGRDADAVIETVITAIASHTLGHGTVHLAAQPPQQTDHALGIVHATQEVSGSTYR